MSEMKPLELAEYAAKRDTPEGTDPKDYQLRYLATWVELTEAVLLGGGYRGQLDTLVRDWGDVAYISLEQDGEDWAGEIVLKAAARNGKGGFLKIPRGAFHGRTAADEAVVFFKGRGLEVTKDTRTGYEGEGLPVQIQFA